MLVNIGLLLLLTRSGVALPISAHIAIEASVLWNFALNDHWTFRDVRGYSTRFRRCVKYHLIMGAGVSINYAAVLFLRHNLEFSTALAGVLGVGAGTFWNYSANRVLNYRGSRTPG